MIDGTFRQYLAIAPSDEVKVEHSPSHKNTEPSITPHRMVSVLYTLVTFQIE